MVLMNFELSDEEARDLVDVLDSAISDLSPEIANTDRPAYRAMLRGRRDRLQSIRRKLGVTV